MAISHPPTCIVAMPQNKRKRAALSSKSAGSKGVQVVVRELPIYKKREKVSLRLHTPHPRWCRNRRGRSKVLPEGREEAVLNLVSSDRGGADAMFVLCGQKHKLHLITISPHISLWWPCLILQLVWWPCPRTKENGLHPVKTRKASE